MKRVLGILSFVALAWFFGGLIGAVVGGLLVAAWLRGAKESFFWGLAAVAVLVAALAILFQGVPAGIASPSFGEHHWFSHAAVGVALASLTMAAFIDIARLRGETASSSTTTTGETLDQGSAPTSGQAASEGFAEGE